MSWRKLTLSDVASHITQEEIDLYRQLGDFESQQDPVEVLLSEVAAQCRMMIRKNFFVKLSPNVEELPPELIDPACDIVAFKMLKRFPGEIHEPRKIAYQDAIALLKQIQTDEIRPESYVAPGEEEGEDVRNMPFLSVNLRPDILR